MENISIALIGAGAVGAYFIYGLEEKDNIDLYMIASGERKERLQKDGLMINGKAYHPKVASAEDVQKIDICLVATKYEALATILPDLKKLTGSNTLVVSLLNGIDSEKIISAVVPSKQIIYAFMKIASERDGNSIFFNPEVTAGIFYGIPNVTNAEDERIRTISDCFQNSKVNYHFCPNILNMQWEKYALNISNNIPQAIVNVGLGAYQDSQYLTEIANKLWHEVYLVAAAQNIEIPSTYSRDYKIINPKSRFSTLQDLDAGRKTEIDMFCGTLIQLARQYNIPTPFNEFAYLVIKTLEQKNMNMFAY